VGLREDGLPDIEWREVPEGRFLMGSDPEKDKIMEVVYGGEWEQPQHEVRLSAYQISRYPITNAQYQTFVEDGGYMEQWRQCWREDGWEWKEAEQITGPERYGGTFDLPNHPVVGVSWYEAVAFCAWLTQRLRGSGELSEGQAIQLPTEAQWEKTARGTDGWIYPWGNNVDLNRINTAETGLWTTSTVGCFLRGKSPYGCEDLSGNVLEWCLDWFESNYYANSPNENPQGPESGTCRVFRGGHWGYFARNCYSAYRIFDDPDDRGDYVGFRLVRTPS
jgi:formylglycine-generating enzyme required for sulfatase activity